MYMCNSPWMTNFVYIFKYIYVPSSNTKCLIFFFSYNLQVVSPLSVRAQVVKGELSDTEGLKYKLEEKANEILEIKKALKLKGQEVTEINVKVGLLEKKLETAESEVCVM